ncbi:hypothetical protein BD626DRAFT_587151 [Schizophyllum amplum]|uniref:Arrestin-like N-terminal domain-containing protein n=1 Tax=Schizophyllum amplum TaxID=97359 RepID=A0A550BVX8_9AGAR|nr:hypothetical protein BD626DRAFT_587151 [Auriculariopsis ampla]
MAHDYRTHSLQEERDALSYTPVRRHSDRGHDRHNGAEGRYSDPPQGPKAYTYHMTRRGKTWGTLTLLADPNLSKSTPTFVEPDTQAEESVTRAEFHGHAKGGGTREGAMVSGMVSLNLQSTETIHSVRVTVQGQLSIGAAAPFTFLDVFATPWTREMGDPRGEAVAGQWNGKLRGTYEWPFAVRLPRAVVLPVGTPPRERNYALPAGFWERHEPVRVRYHVVLHVARGAFKSNIRLPVEIAYAPLSHPPPASSARQLAYKEHHSIPPPDVDPDGWHTPRSVVTRGAIAGQREVEVTCSFSIAQPLCYTRGSVIPCALILEAHDASALDLLSSPTAIVARLRRRLRYKSDIGRALDEDGWQESTSVYETASWWPREGAPQHTYRRCMDGEIHLKEDLKPSTSLAHWQIEYEVVLFPFDVLSFASRDAGPLLVQPVEIATGVRTWTTTACFHSAIVRVCESGRAGGAFLTTFLSCSV